MKRISVPFLFVLLDTALLCANAFGQQVPNPADGQRCDGPVYSASEVTRKARITHKPEVGFTAEARANDVRGVVSLQAVLCRTGRVTDIEVLKGMPFGMTEKVLEAVRRYTFTPAERDGQTVSQRMKLEYSLNEFPSAQECKGGGCAGRLVEELIIEGNRRLTDEEIVRNIKTRPGAAYEQEQVERDLKALLDLSVFDTTQTRVGIEIGRRGGVVVIFHVSELPIIRDLVFVGLEGVGEADVLKAWQEGGVRVCKECPYNPSQIAAAKAVVRRLLAARGWPDATVDVRVDELSSVSVALSFIVGEPR